MRILLLVLLSLISSTQAYAVDWLQDTPVVFSQLRSVPGWTCAPGLNPINGSENALECTIKSANGRRIPYSLALAANPAPSGKWIESFSIAVMPLHAVPDAAINDHHSRLADFPYRGSELRNRFRSIDDMLAACKKGEVKPQECNFLEFGPEFSSLSVTASTYGPRDEAFVMVIVSAGRNKRCLQEPECVDRYRNAKPFP